MKKFSFYLLLCAVCVGFLGCNAEDPLTKAKDTGPFPCYPEVPAKVSNSNYQYVTHTVALNKKTVRNYSMCYDKSKKAARWVAYPLHNCYTSGNAGRTDAWGYDPSISSSYQVGTKGYSTWNYTRGHQIPSADRQATDEMNAQTFYMSNMTPQDYYFNSGAWADLENRVRTWKCSDTLYVITGAHWDDNYVTVGSGYPVPTHYYKIVMRTRSGRTGKTVFAAGTDNLKCIGFWIEHPYTGSDVSVSAIGASYCVPVSEIEKKTGFTFFPELPQLDKNQCEPSDWGF